MGGGAKKDGCADRRGAARADRRRATGGGGHHPDAPSMRRFSAATVSLGLHRRRRCDRLRTLPAEAA